MSAALASVVFAVAAALPLGVGRWRRWRWGERVRIAVDPVDPRPADIAGYFAEVARSLDERPRRLRLEICGRNDDNRSISFSLESDRGLRIDVAGRRAHRFGLRGRWIADHPSPLSLRRAVLYIEPVDANRFRVMSSLPMRVPAIVYAAVSLLAAVGLVWMSPECLAAATGFALGGVVAQWMGSRR